MKTRHEATLGAVLFAALIPATTSAQVAWDAPMMVAPGSSGGVGVLLTEPAGGDLGMMLTFRRNRTPGGVGFRVGLAEDARDDLTAYGGVNATGWLTTASADFPLDVAWFAGAGAGVGDDVLLTIPAGVSLGRTLHGDGVRFLPYVAPRMFVDGWFGDDRGDDDLELGFAVDIGMNLAFRSTWEIRFGGSVGDHDALAVGIGFLPGG